MEPSAAQHSFFAAPVWPAARRRPKKSALPRKRRLSAPAEPEPEPERWTPFQSDDEAEAGDKDTPDPPETSRRGDPSGRHSAILRNHNLPPPPRVPATLRTKHQATMTAILYRSLLAGDYARASRAFGLLIRCIEVDIRRIWGIGLEILLKRAEHGPASSSSSPPPENVAKGIEFLTRLILLYPHNHTNRPFHPSLSSHKPAKPGGRPRPAPKPSVFEFYPALFNLLIRASPYSDTTAAPPGPETDTLPETLPERIKEQMETLMMTPPWSNMGVLWLLRGMVCMWLADLRGALETREEAEVCFAKVKEMGWELPEGVQGGESDGEEEEELESEGEDGEVE